MDARLLSSGEVSVLFGICEKTLRKWRQIGDGPPFLKIGGRVIRYDPLAVEAWIMKKNCECEQNPER